VLLVFKVQQAQLVRKVHKEHLDWLDSKEIKVQQV
jgi:hypothetical protein